MASSSSGMVVPLGQQHDVFLSFRGEDTRRGFISHLYSALRAAKIQPFIDNKLGRGDLIEPALLVAIRESKLSVIVFSKNYASSRWCMDELVHILQCSTSHSSQFVIPVFYDVDPSDVRKQSRCYADAFVKHEERFEEDKLKVWREALTTAGNISGFDFSNRGISTEAELVKLVVKDVLAKLDRKSHIQSGFEGLVGIEKHVRIVESLLCLDSDHGIRTVGIWGMGGIGKTTIADVVFHRFCCKFEACCFVQNVGERSKTNEGLYGVRDQLLCTILNQENVHVATPSIGSMLVRQRLSCTKSLVVIDDVSDLKQVEVLTGGFLFGPGSRIVVTARNKRMLGVNDAMIYKVKELDRDEALDLFHLRALGKLSPTTEYETLSREVVDYVGGHPLALTVLGPLFSHCKSEEDWRGEIDKLKKNRQNKIQGALRLCYDALGEDEKGIFLDIAFCHRGKDIDEAKRILESSGFLANPGVRLLADMSLISVDKDSRTLQMHDLIHKMCLQIVEQGDKNPGKRSRLCLADEIGHVLKKNKGTETIECIVLNMDDLKIDLHTNSASFEKMDSLRLLDIHSRYLCVNKVHLPPDFEYLPDTLKYLRWDFYPQPSLPSRFSSEMLVELLMPHSQLKRLWTKDMQIDLGSLKRMCLSGSEDLAELPDLSGSPNLEGINLAECSSLIQLPSSFQQHPKLIYIFLHGCFSLKILPEMPDNLEVLLLQGTEIEELPSSIWSLKKLHLLGIGSCKELKNLPNSTCNLNLLESLDLDGCRSLEYLPVNLPAGLNILNLQGCESVRSLPDGLPAGLQKLILNYCKNLTSLPVELPTGLRRLLLTGCKNLVSLPKLPWLLRRLDAQGCTSLVTVSSLTRTESLQGEHIYPNPIDEKSKDTQFDFRNCLKLDQTARNIIMADAQLRLNRDLPLFSEHISFLCPGNDIPKWVQYPGEGCSINIKLPPHWLRQGFLGFTLCIVFELHNVTPLDDLFDENRNSLNLVCQTCHKINNGQVVCSGTMHIYSEHNYPGLPNSDHVFAWYFCPEYIKPKIFEDRMGTTISREDWVDASFDFMLNLHTIGGKKYPFDGSAMKLKRCGVSLLYEQDVKTYEE